VGEYFTLVATRVLDVTNLGIEDDDDEGIAEGADRAYWMSKSSEATMALVDRMLSLVRDKAADVELKYNKYYIGMGRDGVPDNFMSFRPRKAFVIAEFRIPRADEVTTRLEDSGLDLLDYDTRWKRYRVRLTAGDLTKHVDLLGELVAMAEGGAEE
jgi:hypothetical protein